MENENEGRKKQVITTQILAEQEIILLRQQILALRKALSESEKEAGDMRKKLDKEVRKIIKLLISINFCASPTYH